MSEKKFRALSLRDITPTQEIAFWERVNMVLGKGSCWEWSGPLERNYYARFKLGNERHLVHRISYALAFGFLPEGLLVCHKCDNHKCVRPDHLFLGTHKENTADMLRKGRGLAGETSGTAKLNTMDVLEILHSAEPARAIGKRLGVTKSCVGKIRSGRNWRHIRLESAG